MKKILKIGSSVAGILATLGSIVIFFHALSAEGRLTPWHIVWVVFYSWYVRRLLPTVKPHAKCNFVRNSDFPQNHCNTKRKRQFLLRTQNVTFDRKTGYCGHEEICLKTPQALLNQRLFPFVVIIP